MGSTKHIGHRVIEMMDRIGISPLTRNYHLFYTCLANSDPLLRRAIRNLGRNPSQREIDQVIDEYCPDAISSHMMQRHESVLLRALEAMSTRLQSECTEMGSFTAAIEKVSLALARSCMQDDVSPEVLTSVVNAIADASRYRTAGTKRTMSRMSEDTREIDELRQELMKARKLAMLDPLTGLSNRRSFDEKIAAVMDGNTPFGLILADIDFFKGVNDLHGHVFGDHVLRAVANAIKRTVRSGAFVARTGGEEFAILVSQVDADAAKAVAERVRLAVEKLKIRKAETIVTTTVSLGVALSGWADSATSLYEAADIALYQSKNSGRNRTTVYSSTSNGTSTNRYKVYAA